MAGALAVPPRSRRSVTLPTKRPLCGRCRAASSRLRRPTRFPLFVQGHPQNEHQQQNEGKLHPPRLRPEPPPDCIPSQKWSSCKDLRSFEQVDRGCGRHRSFGICSGGHGRYPKRIRRHLGFAQAQPVDQDIGAMNAVFAKGDRTSRRFAAAERAAPWRPESRRSRGGRQTGVERSRGGAGRRALWVKKRSGGSGPALSAASMARPEAPKTW